MNTYKLVSALKENNQDHEFYPTTNKMIKAIFDDCTKFKIDRQNNLESFSLMDIGAGNGNVFKIFDSLIPEPLEDWRTKTKIKKYAIEKSDILINHMDSDIVIIGTEFEKQTLIDKKIDVIFCNPPYKEFANWAIKILREAFCKDIYLIIPARWKDNEEIMSVIDKRNMDHKVIYEGDFLDSEYRKARAKIEIIKFTFKKKRFNNHEYDSENDPFDIFFEDNFKIQSEKENIKFKSEDEKREHVRELIKGKNLIEALEELYTKELDDLLNTYKALEKIDGDLLKEMGVSKGNIKQALKDKIRGLKIFYWKELFDNLDKITNKLTHKSRESIIKKLHENMNIDFTKNNVYALLICILKNANGYIDSQIKDVYFEMADKKNIINYKSNKKLYEDGWRYQKYKKTHFKLDYRLVFNRYHFFDYSGYRSYDYPGGLSNKVHEFINDIITISNNLGFFCYDNSLNYEWTPGKEQTFLLSDDTVLMKIRAYKNGNIHCKFNQEFIKALNIEMARINKWIKNEKDIEKELDIKKEDVKKYYESNMKLKKSHIKLLD